MKQLLLLAIVIFGLSACSQYTCPTYANQDDVQKTETENPSEQI